MRAAALTAAESLKALAIVVAPLRCIRSTAMRTTTCATRPTANCCIGVEIRAAAAAAHAATLATSGETLWFHGQRAEAWFHQNCGGRTASPQEVWPGTGRAEADAWLASHTDSYCTAGGAREWSANLSLAELTSALATQRAGRPGWKNLTVVRRGESGRAVTLRADSREISAETFRLAVGRALGWNRILSNWFEVTRQGDRFIFHGRGSGHGVGLCQAGAAAMAARGGRDATKFWRSIFQERTRRMKAPG